MKKILIILTLLMLTSCNGGGVTNTNEIGVCLEYCDGNFIYREYSGDNKGIHCSSGNTNLSMLGSAYTPFHESVHCD